MVCQHEVSELRERPTASGTSQWARQCVACGARVGNWVKRPVKDVPAWDTAAEEAAIARRPNTLPDAVAERAERSAAWWRVYSAFISSPEWKAMRRRVLARANGRCEACLVNQAEQVHHTAYPKGELTAKALETQPLWELRAICYPCHALQHSHMRDAA